MNALSSNIQASIFRAVSYCSQTLAITKHCIFISTDQCNFNYSYAHFGFSGYYSDRLRVTDAGNVLDFEYS